MEPIGYFGVIIPELNFWQGYFLPGAPEAAAAGQEFLETVRRVIGGKYMPPSATLRPMPGVSDEHQPWVGAISAAIVEFAKMSAFDRIGVAAMGMHLLTGFTHFVIIGREEKSGTNTTIENLDRARSADDVRNFINAHPLVVKAKQAQMAELLKNSRTKH
jgi:hypothetical protein